MSNPADYTVGWICASKMEAAVATAFLDELYKSPKDIAADDDYRYGKIGQHKIVVAILPTGEHGLAAAATVTRGMVRNHPNLRFGLMVGIGGGAPSRSNDIRLGDVVVSLPGRGTGGVFQYDYGKAIQNQGFQATEALNLPPYCLRIALHKLKSRHARLGNEYEAAINNILEKYPEMRGRYSRPNQLSDKLYRPEIVHPEDNKASCAEICGVDNLIVRRERAEDENNPEIHYGIIASADQLMMNATIRDKFAAEKGILCFEREAAGIVNQFPCLVIRGICDYADTHRNEEWQGYAAMTAAAYAKDLLHETPVKQVIAEQKIIDVIPKVS
jgi:nucleoside phosphorylase